MSTDTRKLHVTMPDGSEWAVPVGIIVADMAKHEEDTADLSEYDITDWATNNMNWDDVRAHAKQVEPPKPVDYQDGWVDGDKRIDDGDA